MIVEKQTLKIDQVINDSTIVLSWNKYTGASFKQYTLTRQGTYLKGDKFGQYYDTVFTSSNANETSFTENKMPLATDIFYFLMVETGTDVPGSYPPQVIYTRPNSLLHCIPTDVIFSKTLNRLYIFEQKKINIIDYFTGRPVLSKEFPAGIGYCDLATYNGSNELYVPGNDGWVNILNATTLEQIDHIYVAGYTIGSVLSRNGKLYVSSSDQSLGAFSNNMKIYDRATKALVSRVGSYYPSRLMAFDNTNLEMIEMNLNMYPSYPTYYLFAPDGTLVFSKGGSSLGNYNMSTSILRSFPYGDRFITSNFGTVISKSFAFERYLKQDGHYADFAFNNNGTVIYAADAQSKKIDVINYPANTNTGSYPAKLYPFKLFRDDNMLILVSKTSQDNYSDSYILVEYIKL
ncbi:hypothetical protein [Niastella koreensis]|uniref:hypothetical protein n=1 Tax=Niastella koreensis TaxID=354356 RepID=UPI0002E6A52D|nr:hypothetical protein [Niastella koreensis]